MYSGDDDYIDLVFNKKFKDEHPAAYKIATRMTADWTKEYKEDTMERIFADDDKSKS